MERVVLRDGLLAAVHRVVDITKTKTSMPAVTSSVLVTLTGPLCKVAATDFEISAVAESHVSHEGGDATIKQRGDDAPVSFLVNGPLLASVLAGYPQALLTLDVPAADGAESPPPVVVRRAPGDGVCNVTVSLPQFSLDSYPVMNESLLPQDHETIFNVPTDKLLLALDKVAYAASRNDDRYELQGVMLRLIAGDLITAATDGYRMATCTVTVDESGQSTPVVVVPSRTVRLIQGAIADGQGFAEIALSEKWIRVRRGAFMLASRLLNGSFPDHTAVIPKGNIPLVVDKARLLAALKRARTVGRVDSPVCLHFIPAGAGEDEGRLDVVLESTAGSYTETIGAISDLDECSLWFNVGFLAEALRGVSTHQMVDIMIPPGDAKTGAVMVADDNYTAIVMPIRA